MKKAVLILVLCLVSSLSFGQSTAKNFFDAAAKDFVHGKIDKGIATVDKGLKVYPNDPKLVALKKAIEEAKKKKKQQENQEQQDKDKQEQEKKEQEQKDKDQQEKDQKEQEEKEQKQKEQEQQDKDKQDEKEQQQQIGKMTPEQIKQLLETMNNEEQKTQKKVNAQQVKGPKKSQEKDW